MINKKKYWALFIPFSGIIVGLVFQFIIGPIIIKNESFQGIIVEKDRLAPSLVYFKVKNKNIVKEYNVNGLSFYDIFSIGDSIVKKKNDKYFFLYEKKDTIYILKGRFDY